MTNKNTDKVIVDVTQSTIITHNVIAIREDRVTYADGKVETHEVMTVPTGVLVLPMTEEGKIILTREFRHNHGYVYGVPMGKIDEGEDPETAARRELREEVGLSAHRWKMISQHHNGIHEEGLNYYFIAQELTEGKVNQEDDEDIQSLVTTFEDAFELMRLCKIVELRSKGCIWAAYIYSKTGQGF